jgi:hypothetical protein
MAIMTTATTTKMSPFLEPPIPTLTPILIWRLIGRERLDGIQDNFFVSFHLDQPTQGWRRKQMIVNGEIGRGGWVRWMDRR